MALQNNNRVLQALAKAMRPIIRMLIRNSIDSATFAEVIKSVYVDVATNEYGIQGRETSLSRVSAITNLNRREVKQIKDNLQKGSLVGKVKPIVVDHILDTWHKLPDYQSDDGSPAELPFRGPAPSFASLVKLAGRDIPAGAIKTELMRLGLVQVRKNGRLKPISHTVPMVDDERELIRAFEDGLLPAAECVSHNVIYKLDEQQWPYCIISADADTESELPVIREASLYAINRFCDELPVAFSEASTAEIKAGLSKSNPSVRVGIFHYEVNPDDDNESPPSQ